MKMLDLSADISAVSYDRSLRALQVKGPPAALALLESEAGPSNPIRYVEPLEEEQKQHLRNDPATYLADPISGTPYEWAFNHVGLDRALNISGGDSQILVGIVDSGWSQIPDLQSKIAESWYYTTEGADALDTDGHGTFVASIIAAQNDDGFGLAGFCGACRIIPFKVVNLTSYAVASAIRKLVDEHVRIINLSLGSSNPSFVMLDAVAYAASHGVLLVASSGNESAGQVDYPAAWLMGENGAPGIGLAVGASDRNDRRIFFSNAGTRLSLVAPGAGDGCADGVFGALPTAASDFDAGGFCGRFDTSLVNGARYAYASGTSFSAPEAAGVAALVMAARPDLTGSQVANVIEQSATRPDAIGWQPDVGWGVLNAAAALEMATGKSSADTLTLTHVVVAGARIAGSHEAASASASWQDAVPASVGSADCNVQIGGHVITVTQSFTAGTASCRWKVPLNLAGRSGSGQLTVQDDAGNEATGTFTFTIKPKLKPKGKHR